MTGGEERVARLEEVRESSTHDRADIGWTRGAVSTGSEAVEWKLGQYYKLFC